MLEETQSPDNSDEELDYRQFMELQKGTKSKRAKKSRYSKEYEALQQESMKLYITGDLQQSKQKFMQRITLDPKAHDSYFVMGQISQLEGDKLKAAHFFTLSAYLSPPDPQKWLKIGDLYFDIEFYQQAAYCYGRCLKSDPLNISVILKRAQAYEYGQEFHKAIKVYYKLLRIAPNLNIIKDCARLHCKINQYDKARQVLKQAAPGDLNIIYMVCQTYMKQNKYAQVVNQIHTNLLHNGQVSLQDIMVQFLKMLVIAGCHLQLPETQKYLQALLKQIDNEIIDVFEGLVNQLQSMNKIDIAIRVMEQIVKNQQVQKKPEHYLRLAEYYKKTNLFTQASQILECANSLFPNNKNIRSQLGYLKIKIGESVEEGVALVREQSEEEVYISDLSEDQKPMKASQLLKKTNLGSDVVRVPKKNIKKEKKKQSIDEEENINQAKQTLNKTIFNLYETVELKKDEPHIILQLFPNIQSLLKDVLQYYLQLKKETYLDNYSDEKKGLFSKKTKKRRRKNRSEKSEILDEQHLVAMLNTWITHIFKLSCWNKIFSLSQTISKLVLLKRFPEQRKRIYQLCVLACLQLKKYRRAFFLLRYLLTRDPNNMMYILLCNVLVRRISGSNSSRFILAKLIQYQGRFPNLMYLIAFEHLQSGYFEHSIKTLLKIPVNKYNQENIMLCFASCFIQLASSRNTTDKLSMVNRGTYMMNEYRKIVERKDGKSFELFYNLGRFYHQLRITSKVVQYYQKAIQVGKNMNHPGINKAVYSLLCLYKDLDDYESYNSLSRQYFSI